MFIETIYLSELGRRRVVAVWLLVATAVIGALVGFGAACGYLALTADLSRAGRVFFAVASLLAIAGGAGAVLRSPSLFAPLSHAARRSRSGPRPSWSTTRAFFEGHWRCRGRRSAPSGWSQSRRDGVPACCGE
jgi:hypothetical protein